MAVFALGICLFALFLHVIRLIRKGKPKDFSRSSGRPTKGIQFAFTGAMSPTRKESAYLHLPTYSAGLFYHMGTFLSFFLFFFFLAGIFPKGWLAYGIIAFLILSSVSGLAIFIKRIVKKELRSLSNPDDFISNILVTLFQISTILILLTLTVLQSYSPTVLQSYSPAVQLIYYLSFTLLMLYVPAGKLRHLIYFFAARYHLGYFYGWRGVWPPKKVKL